MEKMLQRSFMKHQKPMIDTNGQEKVKSSQQGKNTLHLMIYKKLADINSDIWKRQYDLANKTVHASPQGTFAGFAIWGLIP